MRFDIESWIWYTVVLCVLSARLYVAQIDKDYIVNFIS
jgi:hypothetical protein